MKKLPPFFPLFLAVLTNLLFNQFAISQPTDNFLEKDVFPSYKQNQYLSHLLPNQQTPFSATGDFLVSIVDYVNPATGDFIGSKTERIVIINGVAYKAVVSGRREQMTSKRNIPMQGILVNDTVFLDDNPARVISPNEYGKYGIDPSKLSNNTIVTEVGGQVVFFNSSFEFDNFVQRQILRESQINPNNSQVNNLQTNQEVSATEVAASAWTEGAKTVLYMRLDFPDQPGEPTTSGGTIITQANAQNTMDNSVNPFYISGSYGKTSLSTTVTTVLRMPKPLTDYVNSYKSNSGTGLNLILADARAAATAAGYSPNNFDHHIVLSKYNADLGFGGLGFIGGKGSWLNGSFSLRVTAHELGHNYGLTHANLYQTTDGSVIGAGNNVEYGDCFDNMGNGNETIGCFSSSTNLHFNARYKRLLDWLTDTNVQTITTNGVYRVYAQDSGSLSGGAIRLLRVNRYWIEFRQLINNSALNGAIIRWDSGTANPQVQTQLLDMIPATKNVNDEALVIGQSFYDDQNKIRITPLNKGGTSPESLDIRVEFNVVVPTPTPTPTATPTVTPTPTPTPSVTYNAVNDFSLTNNPNGVWSFGTKTSNASFTAYANNGQPWNGVRVWSNNPGGVCCDMVAKNTTGTTLSYAGVISQPADLLNLHPNGNGNKAAVRWTAPANGTYQFQGRFQGLDTVGTTTDATILRNGTPIWSNNVNGFGTQVNYDLTLALTAGEVIEFAVGWGTNNNANNDSTGLAITVNSIGSISFVQNFDLSHQGISISGELMLQKDWLISNNRKIWQFKEKQS